MAAIRSSNALIVACLACAMLLGAASGAASDDEAAAPGGPTDIVLLGAVGDGKTDSTNAINQAWKNACGAKGKQKILIPKGNFLTGSLNLEGPCKSSKITIRLDGNLIGTANLNAYKRNWIELMHVDNVLINGNGILDGNGPAVWQNNKCSKSYDCKLLPNSLVLDYVNNVTIRGITLKNSKFFHLNIFQCKNVLIEKVTISAPGDSPNTDGIHMGDSENITIRGATIGCGDDCISIGPGSKKVKVISSSCGPGHGISVGSLGRYQDEKDVEDVTVTDCTIKGASNGLRIKAYEDSKSMLKANRFLYDNVRMQNVSYPIIVDMKYCPNSICSHAGNSKVAVEDITFKNIQGTSFTPEAVTLKCASNLPCKGIKLINVNLRYAGNDKTKKLTSVCQNTMGTASNVPKELACL